jgi:Membrane carboxypeptidase/penicillin-binding protein
MLPKAPSRYNPFKNKELAKFRRNLVIKNLYENSYIDKDSYNKLINTEIILKKRKKKYLEDANYYVEDVRKSLVDKFGFDKVYKQGFTIKTPLDLDLQKIASKSLREGLVSYDKRKGWRGPLENKKDINNWDSDIKKYNLEKSINWQLAIIKKINKFSVEIQTEDKKIGKINYENISWTKKELKDLFNIGDIIYVKYIDENKYSLKQIPKANGGIVVMDPFTGRVLAMSGGFSFKKRN